MEKPKKCKRCGKEFSSRNGNARYCTNDCYLEMKRHRDQATYQSRAGYWKRIQNNDAILSVFYRSGGSPTIVGKEVLVQAGFDFDILLGETFHDKDLYRVLGRHCYSLDKENQKIKICKLDSSVSLNKQDGMQI